jgi:WD40 repeat protein
VAVEYLSQSDALLSATSDGHLRTWHCKNAELSMSLQPEFSKHDSLLNVREPFNYGMFFSRGQRLAISCTSDCLHVAEVATGRELFVVSDAKSFAISPNQKTMAVSRLGEHSVQTLRTSRRTATSKRNASILLLDSTIGETLKEIDVSGPDIWALAFSPDGKTLAVTTGWEHGEIHLFNVATAQKLRTISTPPLRSPALVFTPDGKRLISAMADTSVLAWDLEPNP